MNSTRKTIILDQGEVIGGAECYMRDFITSLAESDAKMLGLRVLGAQHPEYKAAIPDYIPREDFTFPSVKGGMFSKAIAAMKIFLTGQKIAKICRKKQINTIVTNTARSHFITLMSKIFFRNKSRWIVIMHDFETQKSFWKLIHTRINHLIFSRADNIVSVSSLSNKILKEMIPQKFHKKIRLVENAIKLNQITEELRPTNIETVLIPRRYDPYKGQKLIIEAAHLLHERNPELQFLFHGAVFAEDPKCAKYHAECVEYTAKHNLENVELKRHTSDPYGKILAADLVIVPAMVPETFGRIVIEALAMGKLVLSFDETGPREITKEFMRFAERESGMTLPSLIVPKNPMTIAEMLGEIADNPDKYLPYTQYGRAFVERYYDFKNTKKTMTRLLINAV